MLYYQSINHNCTYIDNKYFKRFIKKIQVNMMYSLFLLNSKQNMGRGKLPNMRMLSSCSYNLIHMLCSLSWQNNLCNDLNKGNIYFKCYLGIEHSGKMYNYQNLPDRFCSCLNNKTHIFPYLSNIQINMNYSLYYLYNYRILIHNHNKYYQLFQGTYSGGRKCSWC